MERRPRPAPTPGSFTVEATAGLRGVAWHDMPLLLAYHPSYHTNPYQALLYGAAREEGIAPIRMPKIEQLDELEALQASGLSTVLHVHWLQPIQRDATSEQEAVRRGQRFLDRLDGYRAGGGRVAWTVHNVLPHETRFEAAEIALSAGVAARADVIHVLAERTAALVKPYYELPKERILHVPHPSYRGAYADHVSRLDARHELGLTADEFVIAAVGAIRPYKGLDALLDAWVDVPGDRPRRLVIAGAPADEAGVEALIERAALDPRVVIDPRPIPADDIQVFLRAADVAVLPYRRALNSGALMLALTFGLPVIVPEDSPMADLVDSSFARTYAAGDRNGLTAALADAPSIATPEATQAASDAAARHDPRELSRRFAVGLRTHLGSS